MELSRIQSYVYPRWHPENPWHEHGAHQLTHTDCPTCFLSCLNYSNSRDRDISPERPVSTKRNIIKDYLTPIMTCFEVIVIIVAMWTIVTTIARWLGGKLSVVQESPFITDEHIDWAIEQAWDARHQEDLARGRRIGEEREAKTAAGNND